MSLKTSESLSAYCLQWASRRGEAVFKGHNAEPILAQGRVEDKGECSSRGKPPYMMNQVILVALLSVFILATTTAIPPVSIAEAENMVPSVAVLQSQSSRPIRTLPGLQNITVWTETSRGPTAFTLGVNGSEFTTRLTGLLGPSNRDFSGPNRTNESEFYDVFYSNSNGVFNADGSYITVEAAGAGLSLSEIWLQFSASAFEPGNEVASFVALGSNTDPNSVGNAIDNNIDTFTRLGNSPSPGDARRRITIGFASSSVPAGPALFIEDVGVTEGNSGTKDAVFRVRLSPPGSTTVTVAYSTQNFSATAPGDYTAGNGTLTFNSGETLKTITVLVRGDTLYEASEQFFVNLANPVNAAIGREQAVGTIADDEPTTLTICSNDTPKGEDQSTGIGLSTIRVDRDTIIDDVNLSLSLRERDGLRDLPTLTLSLSTPAFGGGQDFLISGGSEHRVLGAQLGTTCSPSPNCILDGEAPTRIYDGVEPYIGTFRPDSRLRENRRRNARGDWGLAFRTQGTTILDCWCLQFELPQEGCRLDPAIATIPIFFPHDVDAILTLNGAPVIGHSVTFTVRNEEGELRFQTAVTSDDSGVARLQYYEFRPGANTIEARTTINGVPSISTAHVNWVADGLSGFSIALLCAVETSAAGTTGAEATLSAARNFRDSVLAGSPRGQNYARLYYQHSTEAVQLMMFNPLLILRSREILERYKPLVEAMASGEAVTLTEGDLDEIDQFLNSFAAKGSGELQNAIKGMRRDLRDPQMHAEFGIRLTSGPKRELPGRQQIQGFNHIGKVTLLFGLLGLVIFASTGKRRKLLRRNIAPLLVVVLAVTVLTNSLVLPVHTLPDSRSSRIEQFEQGTKQLPAQTAFEANQGQTDPQVKFISRTADYDLFLTPTEAVMKMKNEDRISSQSTADVLRMKLIAANSEPKITGLDRMSVVSNYFTGKDPAKWRGGVPAYARVRYEEVYPGVDMLYHSDRSELEYDFIVAPGADPESIGLAIEGADRIEVNASGDLVLVMSGGELRQPKPLAYQEINGTRLAVPCRYVIENQTVRFDVSEYDRSMSLVIDPVIQYSTYLGGRGGDQGNAITVDSAGNAYIIGFTDALDFPTANAVQPEFGGGSQDMFVSKLDASGTQLLYSTYIGGDDQDCGSAIAVDAAGNAFVTGFTDSTNFPVMNPFQATKNDQMDAFIAKLNPTGSLIYSTYLGGSIRDFGSSIAVDSVGNIYVAGVANSPNFPLAGAVQSTPGGAADVYVAKLTPAGNSLIYSTYLGGADNDGATSIAVDSSGNVYVTGVTMSSNFRTVNPLQPAHRGGLFDAFVAKLNPTGTQIIYSTYLGGSGEDRSFRVAVDSSGNAYVTGDTDSANFPMANALQPNRGGGVDAFIAKLNPTGSVLVYSTYFGGSSIEGGTALAIDSAGSAYITGFTGSINFPTVAASQQTLGGGPFDGFVAKLNATGSALDYSTYLGGDGIDSGFGIAADTSGNAYVMGITDSSNFPTASPLQANYGGGESDVFVVKISSGPVITRPEIQGKNLLIRGNGFDKGAKILIDGQQQKTKNDNQNPTGLLISKKAAKKIKKDITVKLQVRNSDGALSNELDFRRP